MKFTCPKCGFDGFKVRVKDRDNFYVNGEDLYKIYTNQVEPDNLLFNPYPSQKIKCLKCKYSTKAKEYIDTV